MVFGISRVFTALNNNNTRDINLNLPMINSVTNNFSSYLSSVNQIEAKRNLMRQYKLRAELTGIVNKVARDLVSDYEFKPVSKGSRGRKAVKRAMQFSQEHMLDSTMQSQAVDMLVTGDGFGYMAEVSQEDLDKVMSKTLGNVKLETKEGKAIRRQIQQKIDEDALLLRGYRSIPSSTVEVRHNQYEIENYVQRVNGKESVFTKEEIVHYTLANIDGKVNGFTPVSAMLEQLDLLRNMWGNMSDIYKNGGVPDQFIIAKSTQPGTPGYNRMRDELKNKKQFGNKHGSVLLTGDIDIKNMQELDKMQFMDSGLYITGLIAMQWSVPRSSIPFIVGGANTKDDTGGNSESDYWANIEYNQQIFAQIMNNQFWRKKFGVEIVFKRKYKQGEIRDESLKNTRFNNLKLMNEMLMGNGKQIKVDTMLDVFDLDDEDVEKFEMSETEMNPSGTMNNQLSNAEKNDSQDKVNKNERKRQEQDATMNSSGVPTGQGKEMKFKTWDHAADRDLLQTKEMQIVPVNMKTFVKLYNEDKQMGMQPPRMFVRENEQNTTFFYKSTDFAYKATLLSEDLEANEVNIMALRGNMYRL